MDFFQVSPEELSRHRAAHDVQAHEVNRLFAELKEDQLKTLSLIMDSISHGDNPARSASFFAGRISSRLEDKFGVCGGCGENHDDSLATLAEATPVKVESTDPMKYTEMGSRKNLRLWEVEEMKEYNLDDLRNEDTNELLGFVCMGCGMSYVSIKDRMVKEPGVEGCAGCQHKSKWG